MTPYTFEPIGPDDFAFRWSVFDATIRPFVEALYGMTRDQTEQMLRSDLLESSETCAIVFNGKRVGVVRIEETADRISLHQIEILPEFQGKGIGTAIVRSLIDRANASGKPVHLSVFQVNTGARRLYDRLGFTVESESDRDVQMVYRPER